MLLTQQSHKQVIPAPVTALSWIYTPEHPGSLQNVLACTQGCSLSLHHATTSKQIASFMPLRNEHGLSAPDGEGLLSCSAAPDGNLIAIGGTEGSVTILDCLGSKLREHASLHVPASHAGATGQAHASRVFTVQWHPDDPHLLLSGGWDKFVKV